MSGWDSKDNTKKIGKTGSGMICEKCGEQRACVCCDSMDEHGFAGMNVCNSCYDEISGHTECNNGTENYCQGCIHAEFERQE